MALSSASSISEVSIWPGKVCYWRLLGVSRLDRKLLRASFEQPNSSRKFNRCILELRNPTEFKQDQAFCMFSE